MQVGDYTQPINFNGKWYIFKLAEKRLTNENLTLESTGVRQQIAQGLTEQHKAVLNAALLETAINDAKIVNHLAAEMLNNPGNLGLRPAAPNATRFATTQAPTQAPAVSPAAPSPGRPRLVRPFRLSLPVHRSKLLLAERQKGSKEDLSSCSFLSVFLL